MQKDFLRKSAVLLMAILMVISSLAICADRAFAESVTTSLSGGGTFEKGDNITVTLKYTGATFGSATAKFTYDSDVLEYSSCSGAEANGSGGTVKVTMANGSGVNSLSCKVTFKAKKVGKSTISASTLDIYNIDFEELSAGGRSTTVTVKDNSETASDNANLSAMVVSAGNLSPKFSKNVTSYTVKVKNSVKECLITASKEDSKAKITVSGSKDLKVGENTRKVTVTAESGKTKTYTIKIIRAEADDSQDKPDKPDKPDTSDKPKPSTKPDEPDTSDTPDKPESIETVVRDVTYIVAEDLEGIELPESFAISEANYNDKKIPVIKSNKGNVVLGLLKAKDAEGQDDGKWYFYNEKRNQFFVQHYMTVDEILAYGESISEGEGDPAQQEGNKTELPQTDNEKSLDTTNIMLLIFGGTLALLLIAVICLQVGIIKHRKRK